MTDFNPEEDDLNRRIKETNKALRDRQNIYTDIAGASDSIRRGQVEEIKNLQKLIDRQLVNKIGVSHRYETIKIW